jgi:hypothetical protein
MLTSGRERVHERLKNRGWGAVSVITPSPLEEPLMPHLHLPETHTEADLVLAGHLAELLGSEHLYVVWTSDGGPAGPPTVRALVREPVEGAIPRLARALAAAAAELWRALRRPAGTRPWTPPAAPGDDRGARRRAAA